MLLPENVLGLVGAAREIASSVIAEHAAAEDRDARWPAQSMRALADAGLLGLHVPEALGGQGQGLLALAALAETIGRESASTALCYAMHCVGTAVIAAKATAHQQERYLVPIAQGRHVTTLALSEPGTGAFFYYPQTTLARADGGWSVSGTKSFVTNGGHADSYVVSTSAADGAEVEDGTFSCVLLDANAPGIEWQAPWLGLGMRSNSARTMTLDGVVVPPPNLLGEVGDQLWYVFEVVAPYFLVAMAGTYVGLARGALDEAERHLGSRRHAHSGELLGAAPVLAHRLGSLHIRLEQARCLIHDAATRADAGLSGALVSILACKAAAADAAVEITNEALTLCGGSAYSEDGRLGRFLRDARASHVMAPTTDLLKTWVGRALLKLPLL